MIALSLYRSASRIVRPAITLYLRRRLASGKEDPQRVGERRGLTDRARPAGPLVWIHAASNGEAMSAQPLIERLAERDPAATILLTTGTVTSARLMAERLPPTAIHQFVPVDLPGWVAAFLDHWRPDVGIWIESELWPNLVLGMRARGRPMALVNGRISGRSFARWRKAPGLARDLLGGFSLCLAQTPAEAERLAALGAVDTACVGNLKFSAPPLPADPALLDALRRAVAGRPLWLMASTHPGEEEIAADVHARLAPGHARLLSVLVPRHPVRGDAVAEMLRQHGFRVSRRSEEAVPPADAEIYLVDTLGELGLFYRLADLVMIGGSLAGGIGGHNPVEAVQLDCALLLGPDMSNFETVADELLRAGGARSVANASAIAEAVDDLLADDDGRAAMIDAARAVAARNRGVVDRVMERLMSVLPPVGGPDSRS